MRDRLAAGETGARAAAAEGGEEVQGGGEGGGVTAVWELEGAYGCLADGRIGRADMSEQHEHKYDEHERAV